VKKGLEKLLENGDFVELNAWQSTSISVEISLVSYLISSERKKI
jgi:hypothetical protein